MEVGPVSAAAFRPQRGCTICLQIDDHPHHTWAPQVIGGQRIHVSAHLDCCAAEGCPDKSCDAILASAGGKRGLELLEHLRSGGADTAIAAWRESTWAG